jgi:hypothetical protein
MPISDIYTGRANQFGITTATATPVLTLTAGAAAQTILKRLYVVGVRIDIVTTTAAAGNNVLFQLIRSSTLAVSTASNLLAGSPHDFSAPASIGQVATSWTGAPSLVASSTILWEQELPQTTGSSWEEFPPAGYEWQVPAIANQTINNGLHVFITQSVATTSTYNVDLIWSE